MRSGTKRGRTLAVAFGLLLITTAFTVGGVVRPAAALSPTDATSGTVDVTATTSLSFSPNEFQMVPTNSTITVSFTDASSLAHTFTIIGREGWVIPSSINVTAFDNLVYGKSPPVLFNFNVSSSGTQTLTFTSRGPGWYEFVCTEPGHFQSGMYGFIAFGIDLPANLTVSTSAQGPGAALFIIIGTIVSLVVIALVLGFVVGRRKGAEHEMPPERLGYPEPLAPGEPLPPSSDEGHRS